MGVCVFVQTCSFHIVVIEFGFISKKKLVWLRLQPQPIVFFQTNARIGYLLHFLFFLIFLQAVP
jgi:hypothetical protein